MNNKTMTTTYWIRVETNIPDKIYCLVDEDETDTMTSAIQIAKAFIKQYCGERPKKFKGTYPHDCQKKIIYAEIIRVVDGIADENNEWCSDWYYRKN